MFCFPKMTSKKNNNLLSLDKLGRILGTKSVEIIKSVLETIISKLSSSQSRKLSEGDIRTLFCKCFRYFQIRHIIYKQVIVNLAQLNEFIHYSYSNTQKSLQVALVEGILIQISIELLAKIVVAFSRLPILITLH